jgi:hypothetical protein
VSFDSLAVTILGCLSKQVVSVNPRYLDVPIDLIDEVFSYHGWRISWKSVERKASAKPHVNWKNRNQQSARKSPYWKKSLALNSLTARNVEL